MPTILRTKESLARINRLKELVRIGFYIFSQLGQGAQLEAGYEEQ